MKDITREEWKELTAQDSTGIIIDVRTDEETEEGMIPGAIQHDIRNPHTFMEAVQKLDPSKNYYIYCRSGGRSSQACQILKQIGVNNTYNLLEGFSEWDGPRTN